MTDAAGELAQLLRELRAKPGLATSARLLRDGLRILGDLTPAGRRDVAVQVAAKAAPELVPAIRDSKLDLSEDEATTVLALLRRLDPTQLEELADELEDPERRREVARSAGRAAAASVAQQTGLAGDEASGSPAGGADEPVPERAAEPAPAPAPERESEPEPEPEPEPEAEPEPGPAPGPEPDAGEESEPDAQTVAEPDAKAEEEPGAKPEVVLEAEPEAGPQPESQTEPQAGPESAPRTRPATASDPDGHEAHTTADPTERSWFTGVSLGLPADEQRSLAGDVAALDGTYRRFREVRERLDELWDLPIREQRAVIRAIPDGWARRRAIETLVRRDGIAPAAAGDFVALLESRVNRGWVLATMIEAGLVEADDPMIAGLAGPRAAQRLRRRYAAEV